jgi:hypothetical protein
MPGRDEKRERELKAVVGLRMERGEKRERCTTTMRIGDVAGAVSSSR